MRALILYCVILLAPLVLFAGQVPDSIAHQLKKEKDFAYANDPSYWLTEQPSQNSGLEKLLVFIATNPAVKWVAYIILALVILLIIYQVAVANNFFVFSRSSKKRNQNTGVEEQLTEIDLDEKIQESVANAEYRIAIRYLYLRTLKMLSKRNLIIVQAKATNNDYLAQMRGSAQYDEFALLTRIYEYVWYGEFQPGTEQFKKIHAGFISFISHH